ncbi:MAG: ANTAR domain-containing protein [Planctomycetota bacterium]
MSSSNPRTPSPVSPNHPETGKPLRIMLVDEDEQRGMLLAQSLTADGYAVVGRAGQGDYLPTLVRDAKPDLILVDTASPDRDTLEQLSTVRRDTPRPVVMFAMNDDPAVIEAAVHAGVSSYICSGVSQSRVRPILHAAIAHFRQHQAVVTELAKTRSTLEERKVVDRAKGLIMQRRGCSEADAFSLLRNTAMNQKKRIGQVAQELLDAAGLLAAQDSHASSLGSGAASRNESPIA